MTLSANESRAATTPAPTLPFTFGGFTIPAGCRRIFIAAELEPSNGDPRIQPTGFPDLGPVLYADPAEKDGLICLIESEPSMANRLEEVCLENKYDGTLRDELIGLPYIKLTLDGSSDGGFVTASTIDGHRFASEYIMGGQIVQAGAKFDEVQELDLTKADASTATSKKNDVKGKSKTTKASSEFVQFVQSFMGMSTKDRCPAANVPRIFQLAMEYDPLALLHGFQISVKGKLTFVGLRSPRAITASILGLNCIRITVPGVRIDPIGTGDAGQAIFQKPRISAKMIEARFSVDVGLLASMDLGSENTTARFQLLLAIALCKISWFLTALKTGLRLRTDCDLRTVKDASYWIDRMEGKETEKYDYEKMTTEAAIKELRTLIDNCGFDKSHSPFLLKHVAKLKAGDQSGEAAEPASDQEEGESVGDEELGTY